MVVERDPPVPAPDDPRRSPTGWTWWPEEDGGGSEDLELEEEDGGGSEDLDLLCLWPIVKAFLSVNKVNRERKMISRDSYGFLMSEIGHGDHVASFYWRIAEEI